MKTTHEEAVALLNSPDFASFGINGYTLEAAIDGEFFVFLGGKRPAYNHLRDLSADDILSRWFSYVDMHVQHYFNRKQNRKALATHYDPIDFIVEF
jgi:hypothetical protein